MSNIVAFPVGLLKKAERIRLERSREEKIESKKSNTDSNNTRPREVRQTIWLARTNEENEA
jgi:hypothetical protein